MMIDGSPPLVLCLLFRHHLEPNDYCDRYRGFHRFLGEAIQEKED